jgi:F0F1-type ATP synthase assembly protein I
MENYPLEPKPNKPTKDPKQKLFAMLMLEAGTEFAFLIGGPLVLGILAGKWLDNKYHHNFFVIIGILLGLFITCVAIYKRTVDYKKMLDNKNK